MNSTALFWVILPTLTPTLELRASIPYALVADWPLWMACTVGVVSNTLLAPIVWVFVDRILPFFLKVGWIDAVYQRVATRNEAKLQALVERWGVLGLALFIGVPFRGTGVYSGCLAAWLLKFRFRDYFLSSFLGCLIAGVAVAALVGSGNEAFHFLYKSPANP